MALINFPGPKQRKRAIAKKDRESSQQDPFEIFIASPIPPTIDSPRMNQLPLVTCAQVGPQIMPMDRITQISALGLRTTVLVTWVPTINWAVKCKSRRNEREKLKPTSQLIFGSFACRGDQNTRDNLQVLQVFPSSKCRRRFCLARHPRIVSISIS